VDPGNPKFLTSPNSNFVLIGCCTSTRRVSTTSRSSPTFALVRNGESDVYFSLRFNGPWTRLSQIRLVTFRSLNEKVERENGLIIREKEETPKHFSLAGSKQIYRLTSRCAKTLRPGRSLPVVEQNSGKTLTFFRVIVVLRHQRLG
jgi:hypothetical protein